MHHNIRLREYILYYPARKLSISSGERSDPREKTHLLLRALARNFSLHPPNGKLARKLFLCEYYIDVTPRAGTNKIQSNPVNKDTERAIESVPVKRGVRIKLVEFNENVRAFFPQGQSKLSVIIRCPY